MGPLLPIYSLFAKEWRPLVTLDLGARDLIEV